MAAIIADREVIDSKFVQLVKCIITTPELLDHLVVRSVLNADHVSEIMSQNTLDAKSSRLLRLIHGLAEQQSAEILEKFMLILREHGQEHAANLFRIESNKVVMSEDHYELVCSKLELLRKYIDPCWSGLVEVLVRENIFSVADIQRVNTGRTYDEMASEIVLILLRKADDCFNRFLNALNETHQEHVVYILTELSPKIPMTEEHIGLLMRNMDKLRRFIDPENGLLEVLASDGALNTGQHNFIRSRDTYDDKAIELIHILMRKSEEAFGQFINALKYTVQTHCVFILLGEGDEPLTTESAQRLNRFRSLMTGSSLIVHNGFLDSLISRSVLTVTDSQRIHKLEKANAKTGYIMDMMTRKSQKQFNAFVGALQEIGQEHVAVLLEGQDLAASTSNADPDMLVNFMKRQTVQSELLGDMNRQAAINNTYPNPMRQEPVNDSMQRLLKELEQKGIGISGVDKDTFGIRFRCYTPDALLNLKNLCENHSLDQLLTEAYSPTFADRGLLSIRINIPDDEFQRCEETFRKNALMTNEHREALHLTAQFMHDKITVNDALLNRLSLCKRRRQAVTCCEKGSPMIGTLMDIVSRQPDIAFQQMVDALNATGHQEVADFLVAAAEGRVDVNQLLKDLASTPAV
jgi:hypothetical protein